MNSKIAGKKFEDMRVQLRQNMIEEMRALALATATAAALDLASTAAHDLSTAKSDLAARPPIAAPVKLK